MNTATFTELTFAFAEMLIAPHKNIMMTVSKHESHIIDSVFLFKKQCSWRAGKLKALWERIASALNEPDSIADIVGSYKKAEKTECL